MRIGIFKKIDALHAFAIFLVISAAPLTAAAQSRPDANAPAVDATLKAGIAALSDKQYATARQSFERGLAEFTKRPEPSDWVFTRIVIPDEDPSQLPSDVTALRILMWRHAMATKQALLMFAAFSAQLEGDSSLAKKYVDQVYGMQSPVWGLSWNTFMAPFIALFNSAVAASDSDNYARYLFLSGELLWSTGEDTGLKLVREANRRLPRDAEIAAKLAGYLVIRLEAAEAKRLGEFALASKPNDTSILIDLAQAEWLLGNLDAAVSRANAASTIRPDLPGPYATRALVAVEKKEISEANRQARKGVELSKRHPFYLMVESITSEAANKSNDADKLFAEAFGTDTPSITDLQKWFVRGRSMILAERLISRAKK